MRGQHHSFSIHERMRCCATERKYCCFWKIFVSGCTGSCQYWTFCQNDISVSPCGQNRFWLSTWDYTFLLSGHLQVWWRHQMETFSALLAPCAGNSPGHKGPVTRSFVIFFDLGLNKRLSKQSSRRWFGTPMRSLWRHSNGKCGSTHQTFNYTIAQFVRFWH